MKLRALILTVDIALALAACAPSVPPPAPPPGGPPLRISTAFCDAPANTDPFLNHVHYTDFTPLYPYVKPPPIESAELDQNIQQDLMDAFNAAPPSFRKELCNLDGVYINRTGCNGHDPNTCGLDIDALNNSWGFRTISSPPHKYIATSLGLWTGPQGHALLFGDFETGRLRALLERAAQTYLRLSGKKPPPNPHPPQTSAVSPNTSAISVLAALAHEFGHVLWYDTFVKRPGDEADTSQFCLNRGTFYPFGSWVNNVTVPNSDSANPRERWIGFGDILNNHPPDDVSISQMASDLAQGQYPEAGELLYGIYSGTLPNGNSRPDKGPWASSLAAFSPVEDFVETYQFYVLKSANPPLDSLEFQISGKTGHFYNVARLWRNKPELRRKMKCFTDVFGGDLPP